MKHLRLFCFIYVLIAIFAGCKKNGLPGAIFPPYPINPITAQGDTLAKTYLALGDSYTIGEGVTEPERYPSQAMRILASQGMKFNPVKYVAQTGWTTTDLSAAVEYQKISGPFDIVTLMIGVNDQYQKNDTTGYRANFTKLLEKSIQLAGYRTSRVVALSIPDYGVTPFGQGWLNVSKQIDEFNEINKSVTVSHDVAYLDITGISRNAAKIPGLILTGGPHFTGVEYGLWATPLSLLIDKALK